MPTKYSNEHGGGSKPNPYADTPIAISNDCTKPDNDSIEYVCNYCHCRLNKMSEGEYYCNRCSISQYPDVEDVRSKSRLSTPIGLNLEPCLSYLPDANPIPKKVEPQGAFKTLQDKGVHITSYTERSGDGHITNSWNDRSNSSDSQRRSAPRPFKESRSEE